MRPACMTKKGKDSRDFKPSIASHSCGLEARPASRVQLKGTAYVRCGYYAELDGNSNSPSTSNRVIARSKSIQLNEL